MIARILLAFWCLCCSAALFAFSTQNSDSIGRRGLEYNPEDLRYSLETAAAAFDGKTVTTPPGTEYIERRIEGLVNTAFNAPVGDSVSLRLAVAAALERSKALEITEALPAPKLRLSQEVHSAAELVLRTSNGLELLAGLSEYRIIRSELEQEDGAGSSTQRLNPASVLGTHFGLMRRSSVSFAFYYLQGAEQKTRIRIKANKTGESSENTGILALPSEIGAALALDMGAARYLLDVAAVQASEFSEIASNGSPLRDDYLRASLRGSMPLGSALFQGTVAHQTLSYGDHSFMTLDTIAATSLKTELLWGDLRNNFSLGLQYGYGAGGADIFEYKARMSFHALGLSVGGTTVF